MVNKRMCLGVCVGDESSEPRPSLETTPIWIAIVRRCRLKGQAGLVRLVLVRCVRMGWSSTECDVTKPWQRVEGYTRGHGGNRHLGLGGAGGQFSDADEVTVHSRPRRSEPEVRRERDSRRRMWVPSVDMAGCKLGCRKEGQGQAGVFKRQWSQPIEEGEGLDLAAGSGSPRIHDERRYRHKTLDLRDLSHEPSIACTGSSGGFSEALTCRGSSCR